MIKTLGQESPFTNADLHQLHMLRQVRNETVHGKATPDSVKPEFIKFLNDYTERVRRVP